jgi:hypothetical protein
MRRFLLVAPLVAAGLLVLAAFNPLGRTHSQLFSVLGTVSPTATARDRALLEFTDPDGLVMVLTWKDSTRTLVAINEATGGTIVATTTTTTTTTTLATTTTTTSTTTTT